MNPKMRTWIYLVVAACLFLAPAQSWAEAVGAFTKVEGLVDIRRSPQAGAVAVHVGDQVEIGFVVRTKRGGKAEIQFKDESVIRLAPETLITIDEYSFQPDGARQRGLLGLFRGTLRSTVSKLRGAAMTVSQTDSSFNVKTPTTIAGVKGTDFIVYYERGVTGVIFLDGFGFVYNIHKPELVVQIKAGQATFVTGEDGEPQAPVSIPATGPGAGADGLASPLTQFDINTPPPPSPPFTATHPETPVTVELTLPPAP
jgi:hypothetical protein